VEVVQVRSIRKAAGAFQSVVIGVLTLRLGCGYHACQR
jgi:hypothetical protein